MLWLPVILALLLAVASLKGERARAAYYRARLTGGVGGQMPPATVIVPVKGEDVGLKENLAALAAQDYPDFELIVTACAEGDVPRGAVPYGARMVQAGKPPGEQGEKIHNLLEAVNQARPQSEILAFADSDGTRFPPMAARAGVGAGGTRRRSGHRLPLVSAGGWRALEPAAQRLERRDCRRDGAWG